MKILIVDDELPARQKLRLFLSGESIVSEILEASGGMEALKILAGEEVNIVFLDIQMPDYNGFEVLAAMQPDRIPAIVFVTAFDQYAVDAFEIQAVDYLLKPYDRTRCQLALQRAVERINASGNRQSEREALLDHIQKPVDYLQRLMVSREGRFRLLNVTDIHFVSASDKYVELHAGQTRFLHRITLKNLEEKLDPQQFIRIHRSTIVNLAFVREIVPGSHGDSLIIMTDGKKLPVSRRYRDRLFANK